MQTIIGTFGNTLPLDEQSQHRTVILLIQLCISFSVVCIKRCWCLLAHLKSCRKKTQGQHTAFQAVTHKKQGQVIKPQTRSYT